MYGPAFDQSETNCCFVLSTANDGKSCAERNVPPAKMKAGMSNRRLTEAKRKSEHVTVWAIVSDQGHGQSERQRAKMMWKFKVKLVDETELRSALTGEDKKKVHRPAQSFRLGFCT